MIKIDTSCIDIKCCENNVEHLIKLQNGYCEKIIFRDVKSQFICFIVNIIKKNKSVKHLQIYIENVDLQSFKKLAICLSNSGIESISLFFNFSNISICLIVCMHNMVELKHVQLNDAMFSSQECDNFASFIANTSCLDTITLNNFFFPNSKFRSLCHALSLNKSIKCLNLIDLNLESIDLEYLGNAFVINEMIESLQLTCNYFEAGAVDNFIDNLCVNDKISTLSLSYINSSSLIKIADYVKSSQSLKYLTIGSSNNGSYRSSHLLRLLQAVHASATVCSIMFDFCFNSDNKNMLNTVPAQLKSRLRVK